MSRRCIIQTLLFAEIFVSTVIWDFVQHFWHLLLVSQFVCHCYSHFCLVLAFVHCHFCSCYILPLFSVFSLSSFPLACMWFEPQRPFFVFSQVNLV